MYVLSESKIGGVRWWQDLTDGCSFGFYFGKYVLVVARQEWKSEEAQAAVILSSFSHTSHEHAAVVAAVFPVRRGSISLLCDWESSIGQTSRRYWRKSRVSILLCTNKCIRRGKSNLVHGIYSTIAVLACLLVCYLRVVPTMLSLSRARYGMIWYGIVPYDTISYRIVWYDIIP